MIDHVFLQCQKNVHNQKSMGIAEPVWRGITSIQILKIVKNLPTEAAEETKIVFLQNKSVWGIVRESQWKYLQEHWKVCGGKNSIGNGLLETMGTRKAVMLRKEGRCYKPLCVDFHWNRVNCSAILSLY